MILLKSDHADVIIMAAAVCDFKPLTKEDQKIKKTSYDKNLNLELEQTPDILKQIKNKKINVRLRKLNQMQYLLQEGWQKNNLHGLDLNKRVFL